MRRPRGKKDKMKGPDNFIAAFFEEFIRSEYVTNWSAEKDSDFFNYPERAERVHDAAEYGGDGRTHQEVINDWREAFDACMNALMRWKSGTISTIRCSK
jgi:hypothetical protein